jgi:predicted DNA-binding transcriptional regulator YafY
MLRKTEGSDIHEMLDAVNSYLSERGFPLVKTKGTLLNDMDEISNGYHVNIESLRGCPDGRRIKYRYEDVSFSLFNNHLSVRHIREIRRALSILNSFKGLPQFDWIDEMYSRFDVALEQDGSKVVQFEESCRRLGMEHFPTLFYSIRDHKAVSVTYGRFGHPERTLSLFPYYLKQFSRRWYLVAKSPNHMDGLCTFSLDRIKSVRVDDKVKYIPIGQDIDTFYSDVYGITRQDNGSPVTIRFYVSKKDLPYLLTCPIHKSQTVLKMNDGGAILSIHVIPNTELLMRFLSFGDGLVVLTDISLRHEIIRKIRKMLKMYDSLK